VGREGERDGGVQARRHRRPREPRTSSASQCASSTNHPSKSCGERSRRRLPASEKLTNLPEPGASITWAREIKNINKTLLTPTILDTIVEKVNGHEIANSKDIHRVVLRDPVAQGFVEGRASTRCSKRRPRGARVEGQARRDIQQLTAALNASPWTTLMEKRGDARLPEKVEEAERLLGSCGRR